MPMDELVLFFKLRHSDGVGRLNTRRQTCKACGRPDYFDFTVPDFVWEQVVPVGLRRLVVCLGCFDLFARKQGVRYGEYLATLYFAGDKVSAIYRAESISDL
jgi:hypothetical protein